MWEDCLSLQFSMLGPTLHSWHLADSVLLLSLPEHDCIPIMQGRSFLSKSKCGRNRWAMCCFPILHILHIMAHIFTYGHVAT